MPDSAAGHGNRPGWREARLDLAAVLMRSGMVWVPVNAHAVGEGLRHVLTHAEPRALVADRELLPRIAECAAPLEGVVRVVAAGERDVTLSAMIAAGGGFEAPQPAASDLLAIMYTSGTTGPAKGVMVTHRLLRLAGGRALPWLSLPWFSVSVCDEAGREVPAFTRGEIVVRAHAPTALAPGYFRNAEATARALRDGRLVAGDCGSFDGAGNLFLPGRLSDSVRVKGENVSAREVEHVALRHPAVADCAMIGAPAEVGEQDITLFVQPREGETIDLAALSGWLGERLAPYQNPRYLALIEAFERTSSQRIMKHRLSAAPERCFDQLARRPAGDR